jgi:hypothetical protein
VQGYLGSGTAALFGSNFFSYGGSVGVPAASILADQFLQGASTAQAFQALANAGYDPGNRQYGERVASVVGLVQRVIDCLQELGRL